jgi:hypothetical protein
MHNWKIGKVDSNKDLEDIEWSKNGITIEEKKKQVDSENNVLPITPKGEKKEKGKSPIMDYLKGVK